MTSKWIDEKSNLEQLILVDKLSYEEIGRRYGCTGSNIKNVARISLRTSVESVLTIAIIRKRRCLIVNS